jgi:hypothetical protein
MQQSNGAVYDSMQHVLQQAAHTVQDAASSMRHSVPDATDTNAQHPPCSTQRAARAVQRAVQLVRSRRSDLSHVVRFVGDDRVSSEREPGIVDKDIDV